MGMGLVLSSIESRMAEKTGVGKKYTHTHTHVQLGRGGKKKHARFVIDHRIYVSPLFHITEKCRLNHSLTASANLGVFCEEKT